jgi:HTH-type transcriptional regulator/antitoxin HipB
MDYIINLNSQLREYLRALRKAHGLTQTELGRLIGVGQARVAEIEGNPGAVSVDQLMSVLGALHATLAIKAGRATPEQVVRRPAKPIIARQRTTGASASKLPRNLLSRAKKGSW